MADVDPRLPTTVNVHEAKTHFSKLLDRAHAGEQIIIAKAGKPYARLVRFEDSSSGEKNRRTPGALKHLGPVPDAFFDPVFNEEELDRLEGKSGSS